VVPNVVVVVAVVPNVVVVARLLLLRLQGRRERPARDRCSRRRQRATRKSGSCSTRARITSRSWRCVTRWSSPQKDKAYFKNLTKLSNSMQAKLEGDTGTLIDQELSNELRVTIQHLSLVVSITKAYKQWVRKPGDAAYLAERARLDDFADQRPEMSSVVPDCISLDEIEISFTCGMAKVLTDGNSQAMEERWRNISLERFE